MLRVHCVVPEIRSGTPLQPPRVWWEHTERYLHRVSAVIAKGKRPAPFRTRKLSPSAPMVLHWLRCGRVGRSRTYIQKGLPTREGPFGFCGALRTRTREHRSSQSQPRGHRECPGPDESVDCESITAQRGAFRVREPVRS